jgi:hypothetical protein
LYTHHIITDGREFRVCQNGIRLNKKGEQAKKNYGKYDLLQKTKRNERE